MKKEHYIGIVVVVILAIVGRYFWKKRQAKLAANKTVVETEEVSEIPINTDPTLDAEPVPGGPGGPGGGPDDDVIDLPLPTPEPVDSTTVAGTAGIKLA